MSTLFPMDFHRRVDRRWAERMALVSADAHGSMAHARSAGKLRNEIRHAREGLDPLPQSDAAQRSQRRRRMGHGQRKADLAQFPLTSNHPPSFREPPE